MTYGDLLLYLFVFLVTHLFPVTPPSITLLVHRQWGDYPRTWWTFDLFKIRYYVQRSKILDGYSVVNFVRSNPTGRMMSDLVQRKTYVRTVELGDIVLKIEWNTVNYYFLLTIILDIRANVWFTTFPSRVQTQHTTMQGCRVSMYHSVGYLWRT